MLTNHKYLSSFADDCLIESTGSLIIKKEMYVRYVKWARENERRIETMALIGRYLPIYVLYILSKTIQKQRQWLNVKFKE